MLKYFQWLKTKNLFYENIPNMAEENINQKVRLKNIEEITNSFIKDIHQNKLISNKHIKVCKTILYWTISYFSFYNYWKYFNFAFFFFTRYSYKYYGSVIGLKICAITTAIKKYNSIIKRKKKKHDKIVLLTIVC